MRLKDIRIGSTFRRNGTTEIATVTHFEKQLTPFGWPKTWIHMTTTGHAFGCKVDIGILKTYWQFAKE